MTEAIKKAKKTAFEKQSDKVRSSFYNAKNSNKWLQSIYADNNRRSLEKKFLELKEIMPDEYAGDFNFKDIIA